MHNGTSLPSLTLPLFYSLHPGPMGSLPTWNLKNSFKGKPKKEATCLKPEPIFFSSQSVVFPHISHVRMDFLAVVLPDPTSEGGSEGGGRVELQFM